MSIAYYYNCILSEADKLRRDFSWSDRNVKIAVKAGLSCVLAIMIAYMLELHSVMWSGITAMVMVQPNLGASFKKGFLRISATILGALLGIFIFGLFVQNHIYFSLCVLILGTFCYYRKERSEYSYFWYLLMITCLLIAISGFEQSNADEIIYIAINRGIEIFLGVAVSLIVNFYIWPFYATDDLVLKLKEIRNGAYNLLKEVFSQYRESGTFNIETVSEHYKILGEKILDFDTLGINAELERKISRDYFMRTKSEVIRTSEWIENLFNFYTVIKKYRHLGFQKKFVSQFEKLLNNINDLHLAVDKNDIKKIDKTKNESMLIMNNIELKYNKYISKGKHTVYPVTDILVFHEALLILNEFLNIYFDIYHMQNLPVRNTKADSVIDKYDIYTHQTFGLLKTKFLGINMNIHVPSLKHAIKASITIIAVIWGWWALELPQGQGGTNIALAVMTVAQSDTVAGNLKGIHRITGCVIGGILGLIFLFFQVDSTIIFCLCLFIVCFFSAYIQCGGTGISYMGLQIAMAFIVAVVNDFSQTTDIVPIVFRFVGIFFGILLVWAIGMLFWRDDYKTRLKQQISLYSKRFADIDFNKSASFNNNLMIEELRSIDFTVNRLNILHEIGDEQYKLLEEWCIYNRRLVFVLDDLRREEKEYMNFIAYVKPSIFDDIQSLLRKTAENDSSGKPFDIENIISEIEDLKLQVRMFELMKRKPMELKRRYSHIIILLKRIVLRAADIHDLKNKFSL